MLKILGLPASNSETSINAKLVHFALNFIQNELKLEAEYTVLDLNDYEMPIYKPERETKDGIPAAAKRFIQKIGSSDAVILSFAEHNGNYSAAFKNVFDWASRVEQKVYQNKPIFLMATSPGARGGQSVLSIAGAAAPFFSGRVFASFSLPSFHENFDTERSSIVDEEKLQEITSLLQGFTSMVETNQSSAQ